MVLFEIGFVTVTLRDLVDITLVALILLRLYTLVRRTIAGQIFIGLLALLAVGFISQILGLRLLNWMLGTLRDIWVIALIVLFQPEIRRILLMIGRRGVPSTLDEFDLNRSVDAIVGAAEELALRKFGALIVVTRTGELKLSVESGVPLEARLSEEVLVSIFNPRSPLHDGAVVVTGNTIRSARVVLPLSASTRVGDQLLGTRHRAALGISEQADVLVVVVSEERSSIGYAFDGRLYLDQSLDTVRLALLDALESIRQRPDRRLMRAIMRRFADAE